MGEPPEEGDSAASRGGRVSRGTGPGHLVKYREQVAAAWPHGPCEAWRRKLQEALARLAYARVQALWGRKLALTRRSGDAERHIGVFS
jgi:hypothetical protein